MFSALQKLQMRALAPCKLLDAQKQFQSALHASSSLFAGHSKWANIRHRKGLADVQRAAKFAKVSREIMSAVKVGGSADPEKNLRLQAAILKARSVNMPKDNVEYAIKRASNSKDSANYEALTYEGYGPGGIAFLVQALTDSRNRTAANLRHIFSKHGGAMGASGAVAWMFEKKGYFLLENVTNGDEVMELAINAGATDFDSEEGMMEIKCMPDQFLEVKAALEAKGLQPTQAEIIFDAQGDRVSVEDPEILQNLNTLVELLDEHDDVQTVTHNGDF